MLRNRKPKMLTRLSFQLKVIWQAALLEILCTTHRTFFGFLKHLICIFFFYFVLVSRFFILMFWFFFFLKIVIWILNMCLH